MGFIEGANRSQQLLFPEYLEDYISEDNPVRIIDLFADSLDYQKLGFTKSVGTTPGADKFHPRDMTKLYLYGYDNAVRSSRKLHRETKRNIEVIWLMKKLSPSYKTIADFRKENSEALKKVFKEFVLLCKQMGLYGEELIAVDGTKIKASNSKKNNYNIKKINRQMKHIEEKIEEYLKLMEENDITEKDEPEYTREEIESKIKRLEEHKKKYENLKEILEETGESEISTVDPDSRLMDNKNNGLEMAYNVQAAVDSKNKLIVDFEVTSNSSDQGNLNNMAVKSKEVLGVETLEVLADKGYYQIEDLKKCEENQIIAYVGKQVYSNATNDRDFYVDNFKYNSEKDVYICPANKELIRINHRKEDIERVKYRNYKACKECEYKSRCTSSSRGREISRSKHQDILDRLDIRTITNMDKYLLRKEIIEHVFGTVKIEMDAGYFLCRGKKAVTAETSLVFLAYNLKRAVKIIGVKELMGKILELRGSFSAKCRLYFKFAI